MPAKHISLPKQHIDELLRRQKETGLNASAQIQRLIEKLIQERDTAIKQLSKLEADEKARREATAMMWPNRPEDR